MKFGVIAFSMYFLVFASCQKPPESGTKGPNCSDTQTKYISPEISNFKFKKGTYWVYIDSISLTIDTLRVDSVLLNGLVPFQYCPNNYHEYYAFRVNQRIDPTSLYVDEYLLDQHQLKVSPRTENAPGFYNDNFPKIDSLFIYDRYYKSVVKCTLGSTILYVNPTFGFLKKEVFNSSNQLISKKLLKDKVIIR